mmetsp:Transcript_6474/g.14161  ORF Transcript_6474/g.14161 Transcript_6474/m.14161 type:complete len:226 (+) Transcript_6474:186-863(+)|eukprot:CAMPEP_0178428546 /NCGR_PEP_ID=MMETSP0689_2-20121128/30336_1 /TAXON_ID=160604 /ORGANISM="Amphidinium massartii, Strain CS-259" /LENGTH=225 /DNA_ID=CAMNT_0020050327 /DNA_START=115 /DNA_END=792 /DNA_ORIENTATION=+
MPGRTKQTTTHTRLPDFRVDNRLVQPPPRQPDIATEVRKRVDDLEVDHAHLSKGTRAVLNVPAPPLPSGLRAAANASGRDQAGDLLRATQENLAAARRRAAKAAAHEQAEPGSVVLEESMLRKVFAQLDIDNNDRISAAELKHLFAQLGMTPSDAEIDGMIYLCDRDGEGQVSFENFLSVFHQPAEALRAIDLQELQEILQGDSEDDDSGSEETGSERSGSSGSA